MVLKRQKSNNLHVFVRVVEVYVVPKGPVCTVLRGSLFAFLLSTGANYAHKEFWLVMHAFTPACNKCMKGGDLLA